MFLKRQYPDRGQTLLKTSQDHIFFSSLTSCQWSQVPSEDMILMFCLSVIRFWLTCKPCYISSAKKRQFLCKFQFHFFPNNHILGENKCSVEPFEHTFSKVGAVRKRRWEFYLFWGDDRNMDTCFFNICLCLKVFIAEQGTFGVLTLCLWVMVKALCKTQF